jgi:hypothetical protein
VPECSVDTHVLANSSDRSSARGASRCATSGDAAAHDVFLHDVVDVPNIIALVESAARFE